MDKQFLYAEYGFILTRAPGTGWNKYHDVPLDDVLTAYIDKLAQRLDLEKCDELHPQNVLDEAGYWGDWTAQEQPVPAHPSWRTTITLWCLSCYFNSQDSPQALSLKSPAGHQQRLEVEKQVRKWQKAVSGLVRSAGDLRQAGEILAQVLHDLSEGRDEPMVQQTQRSAQPPNGHAHSLRRLNELEKLDLVRAHPEMKALWIDTIGTLLTEDLSVVHSLLSQLEVLIQNPSATQTQWNTFWRS